MLRAVLSSMLTVAIAARGLMAAEDTSRADSDLRVWTSRDGKHTTQAAFIGFQSAKVRLRKADGTVVDVPLIDLSEKDGDHVRQHAEDDPKVVEALSGDGVEFQRDDRGRVVQAHFARGSRIGRRDIELLASLPNLERLSLAESRPSDGTFDHIKHLQGLRQLDLTAMPIGNAEVRHVADLPRLEALDLSDTRITNRALSYLKELPKLSELAVANTRVGDEGIAHLEAITTLKKLNLGNVRVSPQGILRLREALPNAAMEGSGVVRRR
jgi:hypothetical protein